MMKFNAIKYFYNNPFAPTLSTLITFLSLFIMFTYGCHAEPTTAHYAKDHLSFNFPADWVAKEDYRASGSRRSVSVETPGTSLVRI